MAAKRRSLQITRAYQDRLAGIANRRVDEARRAWASIDIAALDEDFAAWSTSTAAAVSQGQLEAVRVTAGYLSAFLTSELGKRTPPPPLEGRKFSGVSRDGRPLNEALQTALIGVKVELKDGLEFPKALQAGRARALRAVSLDVWQAGRFALADGSAASEHIDGARRAVTGTCAACLGLAEDTMLPPGETLEIHEGCQCVAEPNVRNAPNDFPRPTGAEIFAAMSAERQDAQFGPEKAQLLRDDEISLGELVHRSHQHTTDDFITERPLADLRSAAKAD